MKYNYDNILINIPIKKIKENAKIPTQGSLGAAGLDLYACIDVPIYIEPHETIKISTGIAMAIPFGYEGQIRPRSGIATNRGLRPANTPSTIDSDYRGEIFVPIHNDSNDIQIIEPNERIAQLLIKQYYIPRFEIVDTLDETERGEGGFGSTGKC